jgi:protein gp37
MSDNSAIEWCTATWNPTTGCDRISAGCDNCYALTLAKRLKAMGSQKYQTDGNPVTSGPGFGLVLHYDSLDLPRTWNKPQKVFTNSMSDLFHARVPLDFVRDVFAVMADTPQHTYQVLTKRSPRLPKVADKLDWPANLWMGVSVENATHLDRIDHLRAVPAAIRFLSLEPLIRPLGTLDLDGIGWVIVGGESGPRARPMHPDWPSSLRAQCNAAQVPFFFKQWGTWGPLSPVDGKGRFTWQGAHPVANDGTVYAPGDLAYPDGPRWGEAIRAHHDHAHLTNMYRLGKKATGRLLDGRTWDEFPVAADGRAA